MGRSGEEPWAKIPHWVITHPDLDASAIRVYAVIAKHARKGNAHPGVRRIAEQAWLAKSTVQVALLMLEKVGAVEITRTFTGKRRTVNNYYLPQSRVPTIGTRVPAIGTPDVPPTGTEQEEKIKRTREQLSTEAEDPTILPGETPSQALRRIKRS